MTNEEDKQRQMWARRVAERGVDAMLAASEGRPVQDQQSLMREIAHRGLWHMSDAPAEAHKLAKLLEIEGLKQPHPYDTPPGRD